MNFFRRLQAPPNPLLAAYAEATGRAVQDATGDPAVPQLVPVDIAQHRPIFAAMALFAEHPGVPDHTEPVLANLLGH